MYYENTTAQDRAFYLGFAQEIGYEWVQKALSTLIARRKLLWVDHLALDDQEFNESRSQLPDLEFLSEALTASYHDPERLPELLPQERSLPSICFNLEDLARQSGLLVAGGYPELCFTQISPHLFFKREEHAGKPHLSLTRIGIEPRLALPIGYEWPVCLPS